MKTISLCMIVKNEEKILKRCLDSIAPLMDEIIIVDTGSTDNTKAIASLYTDKIYDFKWINDFSAARNFSFSKATMDYIYAPDADEVLDKENQEKFKLLKDALVDEVEIVQMYYVTPTSNNTVQNAQKELRPKLFKRLRTFSWIDPIHETIKTTPTIFDSDIEILHLPEGNHSKRDFSVFIDSFERGNTLSNKILRMYIKELYKCGTDEDFLKSKEIFLHFLDNTVCFKELSCALAHSYRILKDSTSFFKYALKDFATDACSEMCYEIGLFYKEIKDYNEAIIWFYNCAFEVGPIIDVEISGKNAFYELADCYQKLYKLSTPKNKEYQKMANLYKEKGDSFVLPETI
ncbi:glycosyltransferase family 2 protein [Lachnobacterium bovis]|uniref:glycosyltransferase family 2 protein n=1 Tax=Lachnobacterium bovis TaxID=140626 RepID=UPI000481D03E|nr:glycosyltransferase family 2 protein [Lachnobacterium bovis]